MSTLERAIEIAVSTHKGASDKAGAPYVLHPLRVMLSLSEVEEQIVGVLHDVVEDSDRWTLEALRAEGFSESIIEALESVTKRPEEEDLPGDDQNVKRDRYLKFVSRAAKNPIGRKVKLADLRDNVDLSRISNLTDKDFARVAKYWCAIKVLEKDGL